MVFYTLNQVINLIETIALNHAQVNSFGFGDVSDISTVQEDYPLVWLNVQPSTINENTFTLSLSLLTLDIQKADQANERDTLSDTLSIAQDIYSALTNPEYEDYFIIQYSTSLTPVREGLPDLVNGWGAELSLDIAQIRDRCQIPTKGFIGVSPSNSIAPTISPSGVQPVGTLFTASVGTWVGTLPITYEYRWTRNGTPINGAANSTYTSVNADEGSTIRCEVRATNEYGTSSYVASSNSSLCGAVPVNTVAPTLTPSGSQLTGTVITLGNGTWTGTSPITYEYRWTRDDVVISGETANTYTILAGDDGTVIKGQVRATNAAGVSSYVTTSNQVDASDIPVFNGLLDVVSGGRVAYGLIKLRDAYAGNCIRVRRASDNAESNIGFVNNELDVTTLETFCSGTNGFVTTFYDQAGNGENLVQSTASNQPQIVNSGTVIKTTGVGSGAVARPAIQWNNDFLYRLFTAPIAQPATMTLVHKLEGGDAFGDNWIMGYAAPNLRLSAPTFAPININNTDPSIQYWMLNGASSTVKRNAASSSTVNTGTSSATDIYYGAGAQLGGIVGYSQVLVIWDGNKDSAITDIFTILNDYYKTS